MSTVFTKEQIEMLQQPIDPNRVDHRQGGGGSQLAYLKGFEMINQANRIFGHGAWGYDLLGVELVNIPGDNGESDGSCYYAARVRLTVAGCVPITEEGVCPVQNGRNPRARIDAHDMARKGAVTDGLKRALRCFGDQFGNSLYDTDLVDGQPSASKARPVAAVTAATPRQPQQAQPAAAAVRQPQPAASAPTTNVGQEFWVNKFAAATTQPELKEVWDSVKASLAKQGVKDPEKLKAHALYKVYSDRYNEVGASAA